MWLDDRDDMWLADRDDRDDSDDDDDDNGDDGHEQKMVWEQSLGRASAHAWWRERGGERNIFTYI
jgi:hypothetical protein